MTRPDPHALFWVFGYGSLMWRPGFDYVMAQPARLHGFHRALCVYSWVHRGTPQAPGLVFGLDTGGSCTGLGFGVAPEKWPQTLHYLREREQVTGVYLEHRAQIRLRPPLEDCPVTTGDLAADDGTLVKATTFRVDHGHPQYAGKLSIEDQLALARSASGQSGMCRDYIISTAAHLATLGISDPGIHALAKALSSA